MAFILLVSPASTNSDASLKKLAEFLGLSCEAMEVGRFIEAKPTGNGAVVAIHTSTFRRALTGGLREAGGKEAVFQRAAKILVYGFTNSAEDAHLARVLTDGVVSAGELVQSGARKYTFDSALDRREIPLAGLSWETDEAREVFTFASVNSRSTLVPFISVNGKPMLTAQHVADTELFLMADSEIADPDAVIDSSLSVRNVYSTLLPAVVFLRAAFGRRCWSNPFPSANMIIDDPLIRQRYGFLEYEPLLSEARTNGYAVTIAFIPFNHARSDQRTAEFLCGHLDRFSLAVHGCDHTGAEFGTLDEALMAHKSRLAMARMRQHQQSTLLPFDPVMVFPQGVFSTCALKWLKRSGYSAAVNTVTHPLDSDLYPLTVRHLLDGAVTAYHSFPLFVRRYPRNLFDFAVDLLFGKPVLLVEHHGYFKAGYAHLGAFVREINRLADGLAWVPLGEAVTSYAQFRPVTQDCYSVKFFTPSFRLRNPTASRATFALEKAEMEPDLVDCVTADGRRMDFTVKSGVLACQRELAPHAACMVKVVYRKTPIPLCKLSKSYHCSAATRRYLSEIRDNYIARNDRLLSLAVRLKSVVRRSGGRTRVRTL